MSEIAYNFIDIPIDYKEIIQSELDIDHKVRSNFFSWNGQFSPQLIETLLRHYCEYSDIVLDPFVGSGTTLCESARKGLYALGNELNVSAYYMANLYKVVNKSISERTELIRKVEDIIYQLKGVEILPSLISSIKNCPLSEVSDILCLLVILLDISNDKIPTGLLKQKWEKIKWNILEIPMSSNQIGVYLGDARKINCADNSATILITSPPYINVLNYHQKYRGSVEALGFNVLKIAKKEFGSNRKYRSNRFFTVIQYCIDMALSIREAIRICKENSRMIFVVGRQSTILNFHFCNSQIIYEIFNQVFNLPLILRQERKFKNRYGKIIYEDILHFRNIKCSLLIPIYKIKEEARKIAIQILQSAASTSHNENSSSLLHAAIDNATRIDTSEA